MNLDNKIIFYFYTFILVCIICFLSISCDKYEKKVKIPPLFHAQGEMAGEVTRTGVILQSRLTASDTLIAGDLPGSPGFTCFEISTVENFKHFLQTEMIEVIQENDYIIKTKVTGLKPGTRYYYRLVYGTDKEKM